MKQMIRDVQYLHIISMVKVMAKLRNYNEKKLQKDVKKETWNRPKQVKMWRVNKHRKTIITSTG